MKQETFKKKISLEKLLRILLETEKQKKKPKISMRKTYTFLEKIAQNGLIHPPHGAAKTPNRSHNFL